MTGHLAVVGAGAVGARVARRALAADGEVTVAVSDADPLAASRLVDQLGDRARVATDPLGPSGRPTAAVLATPRPHDDLARRLVAAGVPVISVSDDVDDVRSLLTLDTLARSHRVPLVVGAAASPGLSGLLARHLSGGLDAFDEVHVAMHGTGGPECARQHHRALAGTALGWHDGGWIERPAGSGRELCWFPDPLGAWDCYRAALPDPILLVRAMPGVERVSARLSANRRDRFTARLPMLSPPHPEGGLGGVRVEVRGTLDGQRVALVAGVTERTAIVAALVASAFAVRAMTGELPVGVVVPGAADVPTASILRDLRDGGLALAEFVGTEERTAW